MSYEGYVEHLCTKGHRWEVDAYVDVGRQDCPICGQKSVWEHAVDQTNGIEYLPDGLPDPATVPYPLEQIDTETITETIPIYKIPTG